MSVIHATASIVGEKARKMLSARKSDIGNTSMIVEMLTVGVAYTNGHECPRGMLVAT